MDFNPEYNYYPVSVATTEMSSTLPSSPEVKLDDPKPNTPATPVTQTNIVPAPNGTVMNGGSLQSPNYVPDQDGWKVDAEGNAEFQSITAAISSLVRSFTAGQSITAGDAIAVGEGSISSDVITQTSQNSFTSATGWYGQTFLTPSAFSKITSVVLKLSNGGGNNFTATVAIRATSGGLPTGDDLDSNTATANVTSASPTDYTFTFTGDGISLSPDTTYAIILKLITYGGPMAESVMYQNTNVYANGKMVTSANGTSWSNFSGGTVDMYFKINARLTTATYAYKTNATTNSDLSNNFIGFATKTVSTGSSIPVDISGIAANLSGLTTGSTYYLSDTAGAIATSAGSQSRKIGLALSATELLIKLDNP